MERRTFVKSGVGSLAISAVNPLEIPNIIAPHWKNVSHAEMKHFFGQLDNAMLRAENHLTSGIYVKELFKETVKPFDEDLFRGSLRSLLLTGNFGDLSIEGQMHPGMQRRLSYSATEVDATMEGVVEKLRSFSTEDCLHLKNELNQDPDLGDLLLDVLDKEAMAVSTHRRIRKRLKNLGQRVIKQLKHSPEKLINDCLKKSDKLLDRFSTEEEIQKFMVANMGERQFQRRVKEAETAALRWKELGHELEEPKYNENVILKEDGKVPSPKEEIEENKKGLKGLKLLGIAGITTAVGWLLIALGDSLGGLFWVGIVAGITVGPILLITALIILIVSAAKRKKN